MMATFIQCSTLLDMVDTQPQQDIVIKIEAGKIAAIGPQADLMTGSETETVIDLRGLTVLPGLVESHDHLGSNFGGAGWDDSIPTVAIRGAHLARTLLLRGITTLRDMGEPAGVDFAWKQALAQGEMVGPRLLVSGQPIIATGQHISHWGDVADTIPELRKAIRRQIHAGADLIKVFQTGITSPMLTDPQAPVRYNYSKEEMKAIVECATRLGKQVAVHGHGGPGTRFAIDAGVHSIEHGLFLTEDDLTVMAKKGIFLVSTIGFMSPAEGSPEAERLAPMADIYRSIRGSLQTVLAKARDLGVQVAVGTDTNHGDLVNEMGMLVQAGYSPGEALQAATQVGAAVCGLSNQIGTIEPGKQADLIAVEGNPLEDLTALKTVKFVMKDGEIYQ
ncbi:MAG: amidohydrolase family protein [Chloroflexota bacterium]